MKFKIKICNVNNPNYIWEEVYTEEISDPTKWGQELVNKFNATIPTRGGELRQFLGAEILSNSPPIKSAPNLKPAHHWQKTNIVGIQRGAKIWDTYTCLTCGITGKMYGIGKITRDAKFKAKKYEFCKEK